MKATAFSTLILIFYLHLSLTLEIRELKNDPLFLQKLKTCRVQIGNFKIIHPINLTNIEKTIENLNSIASSLSQNKTEISNILNFKLTNLNNNFHLLKPKPSRVRRWDALGSAWKWLAGNPDNEDLQIINTTLNQIIDGSNTQITINQEMGHKLQQLTKTMNNVISVADYKIDSIQQLEMLKLVSNIDTINSILQSIQDAIVGARLAIPHSRILSMEEANNVKQILEQQGIRINILEEIFDYAVPKVTTNSETLLYILQIPQMSSDAESLAIRPLTVQNEKILSHTEYLIRLGRTLYSTTTPLSTVQLANNIEKFNDSCISPLILGRTSTCTVTKNQNSEIKYLTDGKILVDNAKNLNLSSDCGPEDRKLSGNFLLTFSNCTVKLNGNLYTSTEKRSNEKDIEAAFYDVKINKRPLELHNIEKLKEEALTTRAKLQHVFTNHQIWTWTLCSKTTILTLLILALLVRTCRNNRDPKEQPPQDPQPWQTWYKSRIEDAPQTCPGGITA